ncbi:MAG: translation elongation factor Ts [Dehalococcoidia bacterium]
MVTTTDAIKRLREATGAGIMDSKRALEDAAGDMEKAKALLRERGIAKAEKRAGRDVGQGLVHGYIHAGRVGALVEVNCETDFVARTDDFKHLVHEIAMQVASMNPKYIAQEDMPEGADEDPKYVVLLNQDYIRESRKTIKDLIQETTAKTGEHIRVARFIRYELGQ